MDTAPVTVTLTDLDTTLTGYVDVHGDAQIRAQGEVELNDRT